MIYHFSFHGLVTSCELSMAPAAVTASAPAMEAAATPTMEAAKTGLSSVCIGSRTPAMAEPAEGAGMRSCLCVTNCAAAEILIPSKISAT